MGNGKECPPTCIMCKAKEDKERFPPKIIDPDGFYDDCSELVSFDSLENAFTVMRNLGPR